MDNLIVICGYYNKQNLGDELYKDSMRIFFKGFDLEFYSPEDTVNKDSAAIVFGGGDVINEYFKNEWNKNIKKSSSLKIALSIGIPYPNLIDSGYLDEFDHVFCRNKSDLKSIQNRIGSEFTHYLPDLAFLLRPDRIKRKPQGKIGVFPIPNISKQEYLELCEILNNTHYEIHLYRFDTSNTVNDDINVINKIHTDFPASVIHSETLNLDSLTSELCSLNYAVCFRFHAHVFCTIFGVPFVSLSNTRKVKLFLTENNLSTVNNCSEKLLKISRKNKNLLLTDQVKNIIFFKRERNLKKGISLEMVTNQAESLLKNRYNITGNKITGEAAEVLTQMISLKITRSPNSKYNYGTIENLANGIHNLKDIIKWIWEDYNKERGIININYINQYTDDVHRSGWNYVVKHLETLNSPYGYIFDTYLDRTFHWCEKSLILQGIIPYNSEWYGFIHHTAFTGSEFNCEELFKKDSFLKSLETCKGIFVLTEYLKEIIVEMLGDLKVPVFVVYHPTDFDNKKFSMKNFTGNIVQVGAWMRDPLAIFKLRTDFKKFALKGRNMDNYFPESNSNFIDHKTICRNTSNMFLRSLKLHMEKRPDKGIQYIKDMINSVEIITRMNNDDYDNLLAKSVVFIYLYDASAVNTLIECVVRNTPIVINSVPAAVEILGEEYPLFYRKNPEKILNIKNIKSAHEYLRKLNKDKLMIKTFMDKIKETLGKIL